MELNSPVFSVLTTYNVTEAHNAKNLLSVIKKKITDEWKISLKAHCVHWIKKKIRQSDWNHLACFGDMVNLVVSDAINEDDDELVDSIKAVKSILTFYS